jgi:hypothetical protein
MYNTGFMLTQGVGGPERMGVRNPAAPPPPLLFLSCSPVIGSI